MKPGLPLFRKFVRDPKLGSGCRESRDPLQLADGSATRPPERKLRGSLLSRYFLTFPHARSSSVARLRPLVGHAQAREKRSQECDGTGEGIPSRGRACGARVRGRAFAGRRRVLARIDPGHESLRFVLFHGRRPLPASCSRRRRGGELRDLPSDARGLRARVRRSVSGVLAGFGFALPRPALSRGGKPTRNANVTRLRGSVACGIRWMGTQCSGGT